METQPYGSGNNWFHRMQETLIPTKHQGSPKSYALEWIEGISYHAKEDGGYHWAMARVYTFTLPLFMGASVLQLGVVVLADIALSTLGHTHYHYAVYSKDQCSLNPVSIREEVKELISHVAAVVIVIIGWLPSITVAPGLYYRKELGERPKTEEERAVDTARQLQGVHARSEEVSREMAIRERHAFLATYPAITPENFDQLSQVDFDGIQLRKITHETAAFKSTTRRHQDALLEYSQGCWSSSDEFFDPDRTRYVEVPVDNPKFYFTPTLEDIRQVVIDCHKVSPEELAIFLSRAHQIQKLVLIGVPLDALRDCPALRSIHTLVLRPKNEREVYKAVDLSALGETYRNIKVFDLEDCKVDIEVPEFNDGHFVILPKYTGGERRVQAPGTSNLSERHHTFNRAVFEFVQSYNPVTEEVAFEAVFRRLLAHPAATFMTKFEAFKGTQLRTHHAKIIVKCLTETCPYLEVLDFRNCYMLDSEIFSALADCKIKHLYLQGCGNIYYRRAILEGQQRDERIDKRETLEHPGLESVERQYVLNMHLVTYGLNRLFDNGIERVRLDRIGIGHERQQDIHQAIISGVYPIIAKWANPNTFARDVKIYYLNNLSFNGVPLAH
ncbi:MAG: hypothetical protein H7A41_05275 [Chlamydiales bacterium]|nr:hypothetical protein [Chlamydiales bacterium]